MNPQPRRSNNPQIITYWPKSGYDFGQPDFSWQDLTARVSYAPSDRYLLYTSTGYDLNLQGLAMLNTVYIEPH